MGGEGNGTPLQYSCLENPMDGGAWWATVHGVAKSRTRLSEFTFTFQFHALKKEMATHSSVLAWRIPGTGEPGGLPSMGSQSRTRLKWLSSSILMGVSLPGGSSLTPMWGKSPGEENGSPIPVFLSVEFLGQRSLVCCSPWGGKESDTTQQMTHTHTSIQKKKKKTLIIFNCGVAEDSWESLGLQRDQTNQS